MRLQNLLPCPAQSNGWEDCAFLTCSVLPVRIACNARCPFCFSHSSISTLEKEFVGWWDLASYFAFSRERGATRLVITGGGEPLLKAETVRDIVAEGRQTFSEIALFTNAILLDRSYAGRLAEAGLSYLCYSRHHYEDAVHQELMGRHVPPLDAVAAACEGLPIRATCVMARGYIDSQDKVFRYIDRLSRRGIRQFTFKHTYTAYPRSVFAGSPEDRWAAAHQIEFDPFEGMGQIAGRLPWGPVIRQFDGLQVCYYWEPTPVWEKEHKLCRSINLLSNGKVYASLEDAESFLFRLRASAPASPSKR